MNTVKPLATKTPHIFLRSWWRQKLSLNRMIMACMVATHLLSQDSVKVFWSDMVESHQTTYQLQQCSDCQPKSFCFFFGTLWLILGSLDNNNNNNKKHLLLQAERYGWQQSVDITETKLPAPRLDSLIVWILVLLPCWETSSPDACVITTATYVDRMLMSGHKSQICSLANKSVDSFS